MIVFDVDDTIAQAWNPVPKDICNELISLEEKGIKIAFASGKNASYLMGLARGIGIKNPLAIGENGCVLMNMEPYWTKILVSRPKIVDRIEQEITNKFNDNIAVQENQIEFTIFPNNNDVLGEIKELLTDIDAFTYKEILIYLFSDAIDIIPSCINKGIALREVKRIFNINNDEIIAVGDSKNDIPMADEVSTLIIIGDKIPQNIDGTRVKSVQDAIIEIERLLQ